MENLIEHQLEGSITLPKKLNFECTDQSQLLDQLKVLQMVMRKTKEKNGESGTSQSNNSSSATKNVKKESKSAEEVGDLKAKIERHKQAVLEKRVTRMKEIDSRASKPDKPMSDDVGRKRSTSKGDSDKTPSKKIKTESNNVKPESSNNSSFLSQDSASTSFQSSSSPRKSIIENFVDSNDRALREKVRDKAIANMIRAGQKVSICQPGEFALKYALSAPYHYFFNRVEKSKSTHEQQFTVTFPELLDISLGEIVDSLHINFMVEIGWLCLQYLLAAQNPKMTIFCGSVCDPQTSLPANIQLVEVKMPGVYGCHHSKVSVLKYKDNGIRIIVSTANIYSDDWENRTQG